MFKRLIFYRAKQLELTFDIQGAKVNEVSIVQHLTINLF